MTKTRARKLTIKSRPPRHMLSLDLDPKLLERLGAWLSKKDLPPTKTAVVEKALTEFLDRHEQ